MESTIKCENPTVILHPYAKHYFVKYGVFCYDGKIVNLSSFDRSYRIRNYEKFYNTYVSTFFSRYKVHPERSFSPDTLFDSYHFISDDGVCYPFFIIVPCGKCTICSYTRLSDISARCELETFTHKSNPLFVTLTYDNDHLPSDGNVSLDDIQKFLKLLRININRFFATQYTDDNGKVKYRDAKISLRYLYSSEYAPKNKRPHFHLLLWNVPYFPSGLSEYQKKFCSKRFVGYPSTMSSVRSFGSFNALSFIKSNCVIGNNYNCDLGRIYGFDILKKLVWCSWKKGFIKCEVSRDAGKYVAKYIGKGSDVPKGKLPTFVRWSTRRGLGFDAFDLYFKDILLKNPSLTQLTFCDPKRGSVKSVLIPKYYRSLLAPCLSVIAKPFRESLEQFFYCYRILKKFRLSLDFEVYKSSFFDIYDKFKLFDPLVGMSSTPIDSLTLGVINKFKNQFLISSNRQFFSYISGVVSYFWHYYIELMNFDIDSLHLQDILDYKTLSTLSRVEYAKNNAKSTDFHLQKANDYYVRVRRREFDFDVM